MNTGEVIAIAVGASGIVAVAIGAVSIRRQSRRTPTPSMAVEEAKRIRETVSAVGSEEPVSAYAPEAAPPGVETVPSARPAGSRSKGLRRRSKPRPSPRPRAVDARRPREIPSLTLVDCTVFAPLSVARDHWMLVQVYLHKPGQAKAAAAMAAEVDVETGRRGVGALLEPLATGAIIDIELEMAGLLIDEPEQRIVWRDRPTAASFSVKPPSGHPLGPTPGVVIVRAEGIPLRRIAFQVTVERKVSRPPKLQPQHGEDVRFRSAFVSYATADRPEVVARAQVLTAAGITYFQDVLSLDPGERWKREIYRRIDDCDLFLLFWSKSAKGSQWVRREALRATAQQAKNPSRLPEVRPVILPPPPVERPWPELAHLHFNDRLLCPSLTRVSGG